jgi:hypothetical protein
VDGDTVYGFGRNAYATHGSHIGLPKTFFRLFAYTKPKPVEKKPEAAGGKPPKKKRRRRRPKRMQYRWTKRLGVQARSMVLAGDTLFLAGTPEVTGKAEALDAFEGKKGGLLWAVSTKDGSKLAELKLDAPPVFDGLIAAAGKLFLCDRAGAVLCLQ